MELAPGGEMFSDIRRLGRYSLSLARFYTAELVLILEYMHGARVIHRDLKPENLLFRAGQREGEGGHLKLTDFGTAKEILPLESMSASEKRRGSFVGTAEYVSPEVLQDKQPTPSADLWSLGCILFQMLTGKVPFRGNSEYLTFQKILKGQVRWPEEMDRDVKDLLEKLLVVDPAKRLGAASFSDLKAHPFFNGIDWAGIWEADVPPRPQPVEITPDEPDIIEYDAPASDHDASDDDDGSDPDSGGRASDEEFREKMEELAQEEIRRQEEEERQEEARRKKQQQQQQATSPTNASSASTTASKPSISGTSASVSSSTTTARSPSTAAAFALEKDEERDTVSTLPPSGPTVSERIAGTDANASSNGSASANGGKQKQRGSLLLRTPKTSTSEQYTNSVWSKFLNPGEKIVYTGLIIKRRALFARKRQLILTAHPRLFYVDPERMEMKKEVEWSEKLWAEVVDDTTFYIHVPNRDYYMRGLSSSAYCWVNEINKSVERGGGHSKAEAMV
jgi:3-phosphoinositide dependent protein kinase-1